MEKDFHIGVVVVNKPLLLQPKKLLRRLTSQKNQDQSTNSQQ